MCADPISVDAMPDILTYTTDSVMLLYLQTDPLLLCFNNIRDSCGVVLYHLRVSVRFLSFSDAPIVTKKPMHGKLSIQGTNFNGIIGILYRPLALYDGILS